MQLDKFTDYALRVLMMLAVRAPDRVRTSEIAAIYTLSDHHLSKVATQLANAGFVASERGRNGGLTLAMPAEDILIGAVVRAMSRNTFVAECFGPDKSCLILPACGLRGPLEKAQDAFFATLDGYTLADVTQSKRALAALLITVSSVFVVTVCYGLDPGFVVASPIFALPNLMLMHSVGNVMLSDGQGRSTAGSLHLISAAVFVANEFGFFMAQWGPRIVEWLEQVFG